MTPPEAPGHPPTPSHDRPHDRPRALLRIAAWAVHALTASGALIAMQALAAVGAGDLRAAFLWLGLALLVDAIDGPLARRLEVARVLPQISGEILDLVVDYLTYVVVPAAILATPGFLPEGSGPLTAGVILAASLYTFANRDMKTPDNFFEGFPAVWNVVALYMWVLETPPWANLAVVALCVALTFTRLKFAHPLRVVRLRPLTLAVTVIWAGLSLYLVLHHPAAPGWAPDWAPDWALWPWLGAAGYFLAVTAWRTFAGAPRDATRAPSPPASSP